MAESVDRCYLLDLLPLVIDRSKRIDKSIITLLADNIKKQFSGYLDASGRITQSIMQQNLSNKQCMTRKVRLAWKKVSNAIKRLRLKKEEN